MTACQAIPGFGETAASDAASPPLTVQSSQPAQELKPWIWPRVSRSRPLSPDCTRARQSPMKPSGPSASRCRAPRTASAARTGTAQTMQVAVHLGQQFVLEVGPHGAVVAAIMGLRVEPRPRDERFELLADDPADSRVNRRLALAFGHERIELGGIFEVAQRKAHALKAKLGFLLGGQAGNVPAHAAASVVSGAALARASAVDTRTGRAHASA